MNRIKAIAFIAIANFALAAPTFAQDSLVQATIPFDFPVGSKLLPSGVHTFKKDAENSVLIRHRSKAISSLALMTPDSHSAAGARVLTFHHYGDQYFLGQILSDSANLRLKVPTSKKERKTQLQQAKVTPPDVANVTLVAAR
jgi:hypothetical protein